MDLPKEVQEITYTLNNAGFEAYVVGGCVRDYLCGFEPKDYDITTSATPNQAKTLFRKTVDTGIEHGTITVIINKLNIEVTTYRIDGEYIDYRRPKEVLFTSKLQDDLSRRDFTINAIAYHPDKGFADPFGGKGDIKCKLIKGVGDADKRFNEDALRMLRAVRFSVQLGFTIEENTKNAIIKNAHLIDNISIERIQSEFSKLLLSDYLENILLLKTTGLSKHFLKELDSILSVNFEKLIKCLKKSPKSLSARLALLFSTLDYKDVEKTLKTLRFDNKTIKESVLLVKWFNVKLTDTPYETRKILSQIGAESFKTLLNIRYLFAMADQNLIECKTLDNIYDQINDTTRKNQCYSLKTLAVNGNDLKSLGIGKGEKIGELLNYALDIVLREPSKNDKEFLLNLLRQVTL